MCAQKIGLVSEYFYPHLGGITEHVYYYARELLRRGFEVTLFTGYQGEDPGIPPLSGLKIVRLGRSIPIFSNHSFAKVTLGWNIGAKIQAALRDHPVDILHIHSATMPMLPLLFQKYSRTTTIGTLHTYFDSSLFYRLFHRPIQGYLDALDGIIAVAPSCISAMQRYFTFEAGSYRVIPNGVDIDWFSKPSGRLEKHAAPRPTVLFLGRLDPRNGLDILLQAFPIVLQSIPHARLIIAGDGPLRAMYEEQAKAYLNRSVFFDGPIRDLRPDYFAASTVFCYPATKASFGITLLEAMAAGTPVVATDNCGFRDVIDSGKTGLLVPQDNPAALAKALTDVLGNPVLAHSLAARARAKVEAFSWSSVTDQILAYYDEILSRKKRVSFAA